MKNTLFLILSVWIPTFVFAQETEKEEPKELIQDYYVVVEESLAEIPSTSSTATKLPALSLMVPASVGVVTSFLFQSQDAVVLGDALKNVSGVNPQTGFGVFDFFTVRGFDSLSSGLVLTDGAPEPEVTFYQLYNVDRVEVLKGPGAFLYGGNPLSASVNLIRKQPLFRNFFRIGSSFGQFGTYRGTLDFNLGNPTNDLAFRFNSLWQSSNQYRDDKENSDVAVNPAFSWRLSDQASLQVNFEYLHNDYQPDSGIPVFSDHILDVPRTRSYQTPFDTSEQNIHRTRIDYENKINDSITIRNKFYYTLLDWLSKGTLINGAFADATGEFQLIRTLPVLDDRQNMLGNQFEAIASFQTLGLAHKFLAGFELTSLSDDFTLDVALLPPISASNPVETATEPLFFIQSSQGDTRSIIAAPYFVDRITLSKQFEVVLGGRFDILNYDDQISSTSRDENRFSPFAGVVYAPSTRFSLYWNAGRAFAPPSTLVVGERKPEESTQFEAGIKTDFYQGRLMASAAFYHLEKENIAIPDETGVTRQAGDQRSRGLELDVAGNPGNGWNLFLVYAYNDAELTRFSEALFNGLIVDRSGNTPVFSPHHMLNLWITKSFRNGISAGGGPRYVSSQFIAEDNAFAIEDYLVFDAGIFYDWNRWRFSLNFKNLTDQDYETRGFGSSSIIPANPFALYAGVDFRL